MNKRYLGYSKRLRLIRKMFLKLGVKKSGYFYGMAENRHAIFNKSLRNQVASTMHITDEDFRSRIRCMRLEIAGFRYKYSSSRLHPFFKYSRYLANKQICYSYNLNELLSKKEIWTMKELKTLIPGLGETNDSI